jgi:Flp pilus assembly pilin Flp
MLTCIGPLLRGLLARWEREDGQALAEYGLILALIVVAAILSLTALGVAIATQFDAIVSVLP